jgi:hypothetical protein
VAVSSQRPQDGELAVALSRQRVFSWKFAFSAAIRRTGGIRVWRRSVRSAATRRRRALRATRVRRWSNWQRFQAVVVRCVVRATVIEIDGAMNTACRSYPSELLRQLFERFRNTRGDGAVAVILCSLIIHVLPAESERRFDCRDAP